MILTKLFKRFRIIFVLTLVLIPVFLYAQNPLELKRQIEQVSVEREALLAEQRKLEAELLEINKEAQTLGTAVKSLQATRNKLQADINVTNSKIRSASLSIQSLEDQMSDKEFQISAHQKAIASVIYALSQYDSRSLVLDLLSSETLSDIWRDRGQLNHLGVTLDEEITLLRETKVVLSQEKAEREKVKEQQARLQAELDGQRSVVDANKRAQEALLRETKNQEAEYQKMLAENIARQKQFEADLFRLESELQIALDPTLIPTPRPGILAWPLENVFVTQRFGRTNASGRLYASGTHNGVDFRAAQGTAVKAMLGGVVEGTGNTDEQRGCYSYGRWILIKHSNGLSSIYAHLSASLVKTGQTVTTGQNIGYSGGQPRVFGSGYSTGPHLHVGLFASQGVSVRQFTSSINCKQVVVPIADVKAYLDPLAYLPAL